MGYYFIVFFDSLTVASFEFLFAPKERTAAVASAFATVAMGITFQFVLCPLFEEAEVEDDDNDREQNYNTNKNDFQL